MGEVVQSSSKVLTSLISPPFDEIYPTSLSYHLLFQTLTSVYQLLDNALPDCFGEHWLCVPPGPNPQPPFVFLPTVLVDSFTLPLVNCSEPNITTTPYLSISHPDCFNSSRTYFVNTLTSADWNSTITLSTTAPNSYAQTFTLCLFYVAHKYAARWSVPWCSFFQC